MNNVLEIDDTNMIAMKLLHYFITEKNYTPIVLNGVDDEIWLENLDEDCEIIRIVIMKNNINLMFLKLIV